MSNCARDPSGLTPLTRFWARLSEANPVNVLSPVTSATWLSERSRSNSLGSGHSGPTGHPHDDSALVFFASCC